MEEKFLGIYNFVPVAKTIGSETRIHHGRGAGVGRGLGVG
jgi:phosphoenolpyruvate carboxylase